MPSFSADSFALEIEASSSGLGWFALDFLRVAMALSLTPTGARSCSGLASERGIHRTMAVPDLERLFDGAVDEILRFAYRSQWVMAFGEAGRYGG